MGWRRRKEALWRIGGAGRRSGAKRAWGPGKGLEGLRGVWRNGVTMGWMGRWGAQGWLS